MPGTRANALWIVRRVMRDLIFVSVVVFLAGCILLLISHILMTPPATEKLWGEIAREFGLVLCSIGLISVLYETLIRRELIADYSEVLRDILDPDARRLGIAALFQDRDDKTNRGRSIDALLRRTTTEMLCLGLGFYQFLPEKRELLLAKLREGCSFRFLIFDPNSPNAAALDKSLGYDNGSLIAFLHAQHNYFVGFLAQLEREQGLTGRFEVRTYDSVPTFGALHLDRESNGARLVVELFGHRVEGAVCPGLELVERDSSWYGFYDRQISELWGKARPLTPPTAQAAP